MKYSIFDIIGPIMIGPSSSHTAGALRLATVARILFDGKAEKAVITLYGSFADTYKGHGTDKAIAAGLLGFAPDDLRVSDSLFHARQALLKLEFVPSTVDMGHPNTLMIELYSADKQTRIIGKSVGGGNIIVTEFDDYDIEYTGKYNTIIIEQDDVTGVLAHITGLLLEHDINIATMKVYRSKKSGNTATLMETDDGVSEDVLNKLREIKHVKMAQQIGAMYI